VEVLTDKKKERNAVSLSFIFMAFGVTLPYFLSQIFCILKMLYFFLISIAVHVKIWTPGVHNSYTMGVIICERLNLLITMMIHTIFNCFPVLAKKKMIFKSSS